MYSLQLQLTPQYWWFLLGQALHLLQIRNFEANYLNEFHYQKLPQAFCKIEHYVRVAFLAFRYAYRQNTHDNIVQDGRGYVIETVPVFISQMGDDSHFRYHSGVMNKHAGLPPNSGACSG